MSRVPRQCVPQILNDDHRMQEDVGSGALMSTYARISSVEAPAISDLEEYWEEPASYFLTQGRVDMIANRAQTQAQPRPMRYSLILSQVPS